MYCNFCIRKLLTSPSDLLQSVPFPNSEFMSSLQVGTDKKTLP
ncbi:hypothetical protein LEP1GSC192_0623 [Leptospira sp. B5-022]|nr:hypothetical protein LEP1GSC192_0623 [Leptospira sp. B5-022]